MTEWNNQNQYDAYLANTGSIVGSQMRCLSQQANIFGARPKSKYQIDVLNYNKNNHIEI